MQAATACTALGFRLCTALGFRLWTFGFRLSRLPNSRNPREQNQKPRGLSREPVSFVDERSIRGIDPVKCLRDYYSRIAAIHLKDTEARYNTANGWKGPAPSEEEHNRVNLYKRLGSGGVDFPGSSQCCANVSTTGG